MARVLKSNVNVSVVPFHLLAIVSRETLLFFLCLTVPLVAEWRSYPLITNYRG